MAQNAGLNYLIAIELQNLEGLRQLHKHLSEVQAFKDVEFSVQVTDASLRSLTRQVRNAVTQGLAGATVPAAGGSTSAISQPVPQPTVTQPAAQPVSSPRNPQQANDKVALEAAGLETALRDLTSAVRSMGGRVSSGPGAAAEPSVIPPNPAQQKYTAGKAALERQIAEDNELLKLSSQYTNPGKMSHDVRRKLSKAFTGRKRRDITGLLDNIELGGADAENFEVIESYLTEQFNPGNIQKALMRRIGATRSRVSAIDAKLAGMTAQFTPDSTSQGGLSGELKVGFDANSLKRVFDDGARVIADGITSAMQTATQAMAEYLKGHGGQAQSNYGNEVTPKQFTQNQSAIRPTGLNASVQAIRANIEYMDSQSDSTAAELMSVNQRIETRRKELDNIRSNTSVKTDASWLAAQEAEVAALEKKRDRLQVDLNNFSRSRALAEGQIRGMTGAQMYNPAASRDQMTQAALTWINDPYSQTARADRRAARYVGGLDSVNRDIFIDAMNSGVLALTDPPQSMVRQNTRDEVDKQRRRIGEMQGRFVEANDAMKQVNAKLASAKTDAERTSLTAEKDQLGKALNQIFEEIDKVRVEIRGATYRDMNKLIEGSMAQYRAVLAKQFESGQLTDAQYRSRIGAFQESSNKYLSLKAGNPDIMQEAVLIPQSIAEYVKTTLKKYQDQLKRMAATGVGVDADLRSEIESVNLLRVVAGRTPQDQAEALRTSNRIGEFLQDFTSAKTGFERFRPRRKLPVPMFNPNLSVDTFPMTAEEAGGLPYIQDQASRASYLARFQKDGGAFAPLSEERRDYVTKMYYQNLKLKEEQERQGRLEGARETEKRMVEYQREIEFGGRYYYLNAVSQNPDIVDGVLMAPDERKRVRAGGARSRALPNPFSPEGQAAAGTMMNPFQAQLDVAQKFDSLLINMEGHTARLSKTLADLSKANFDPLISQFERLAGAIKPMADVFEKFTAAAKAGVTTADYETRQKALTSELAKRAQIREKEALTRAEIKKIYGTDLEQEAKLLASEAERARTRVPIQSTAFAADELREIVSRAGQRATQQRLNMMDTMMQINAARGNGIDPLSLERSLGKTGTAYDATMNTYASAIRQAGQAGVRLGDRQVVSPNAMTAAERVLQLQQQRNDVGGTLRSIEVNEAALDNLAKRGKISRQYGTLEETKKLRDEYRKLRDETKGLYEGLATAGVISQADLGKLDKVKDKHREITKALNEQYDALLKTTSGFRKKNEEELTGLDGFAMKVERLSQYVLAGSVVYTISNAIRRAFTTAIDADMDVKRLQGILDSKSGVEAQGILQGGYTAAMDTGQSVQSALDLSKVFAQTGAGSQQVQELTRAALRGQVGAGLEGNQAAEFLIAVRNITQGNIGSADILDRISRVESQYAVSARDLSVAIQRAGSLAQQLQPQAKGAVSAIDLIIGSATAVIERTRVSGEQASTSLRFIFSRLLQPEVGRSLQNRFGVRLGGEQPGSIRPLQDILGDIAGKYQDLNRSGRSAEAAQLLVTFAGARQANAAAALLNDFSKALEVAKESSRAYGDTQQRVNLQLDTIQGQYQRLQTGLASMATAILNESGIATIAKGVLGFGADAAQAISGNGRNGLASTGSTLAASFLGAKGLQFGLSRFAAAAPASALAGSATVAAGAASVAGYGILVLGALELIGQAVNWGAEKWKEKYGREVEEFDLRTFRQSDFYKNVTEQAQRFGMSPEQMQRQVSIAVLETQQQVRRQFGAEAENERSPRANEVRKFAEDAFLQNMSKQISAFAAIGDRTQQLAAGLSLLGTNIKFSGAPETEAMAKFRQQSTDYFTGQQEILSELSLDQEKKFREMIAKGDGGMSSIIPFMTIGRKLSNALGDFLTPRAILNGQTILRGGGISSIAEQVGKSPWGEAYPRINQFARENLILTGGQYDQTLQNAASKFSLAGRSFSQADLIGAATAEYVESLKAAGLSGKELSQRLNEATEDMRDPARIIVNQERIVDQMMPGLMKRFNLTTLAEQTEADSKRILNGDEESFALGTAYKQILERAARRLEERANKILTGKGATEEEMTNAQKALSQARGLQDILGRAEPGKIMQLFDANGTIRAARERMLEPYIQYATRMAEVNAMSGLQSMGVDYDPLRARYDAALQFQQNKATVRPRLLGDLVRSGFQRAMLGGLTQADAEAVMSELIPGEDNAMQLQGLDSLAAGAKAEQAVKIDRRFQETQTQLRAQLEMEQQGLASLAKGFVDSGNKEQASAFALLAKDMGALISELVELDPKAKGVDVSVASLSKRLKQLQDEVERTSQESIAAFISNQRQIREANRRRITTQAEGERGLAEVQAFNQMRMGRVQALGGRPGEILVEQLRAQSAQTAQSLAALQKSFTEELGELNRQLALNPQSEKLREDIRDLENSTAARRAGIENQDRLARLQIPDTAVSTLLSQQTQQLNQTVDGMLAPIKGFLMSGDNFGRDGYKALLEGLGNAAQEAIVNNFIEKLQYLIQNPIVDSFRNGGLFTKQAIIEGFVEGSMAAQRQQVAAAMPASAAVSAYGLTPPVGTAISKVPGQPSETLFGLDISGSYQQQFEMALAGPQPLVASNGMTGAQLLSQYEAGGGQLKNLFSTSKTSPLRALGDSALSVGGSLVGAQVGRLTGKKDSFRNEGAAIGSLVGSALGPVGGFVGGLAGGLIGGFIGKKGDEDNTTEALQKIERNTREAVRALESQTQMLQLDNRFVNVPTGFTVPTYRPFGVNGGNGGSSMVSNVNNIDVTITAAAGADPNAIGRAVANEISRQLSAAGNSFDSRTL